VLTLCRASPALSGAVARGLAPYSVWAQAVVNGAQARRGRVDQGTQRARVKTEVYGAPPKREAVASAVYVPGAVMPPAHVDSPAQERAAGVRMPGAYPERSGYAEHEGSPTDSDDSDHIVPIAGPQPRGIRTPLQPSSSRSNQPASSFFQSQTSHTSTPTPTTQGGRTLQCSRCYKPFTEGLWEPGRCIYHPSDDLVQYGNKNVFACCHQDEWTLGCKREEHISTEAAAASPLAQTQADASNPHEQTNKRRKL
jgi:hypothetical protein